ncbi:MAG TPA: peptide-methionine (S)-S-oxide reductase MsrA [Cyclobacteriaceae bacterium]|nr:peptide-methionine (S)-S-oxide reductase MsrA [Cyclobacteriaceae bacterium]
MKLIGKIGIALTVLCLATACQGQQRAKNVQKPALDYSKLDTATFAGGCFWCVEAAFEQINGVEEAVSGYAGGKEENPSYSEVSNGRTGHAETVEIYYDPEKINYPTLLRIFFTAHDPTQLNRQGPDIGRQYRSVIFYHNEEQKQMAEEAIEEVNVSGEYSGDVVTELLPYRKFWPAEDYHQDYEKHNPNDPYIKAVSRPKIDKVADKFSHLLKRD